MAGPEYTVVEYGAVGVLFGAERGAYPYGNSLLVKGSDSTLVVDPSLSLVEGAPPADLVLVSHAHEDHIAGLGSYDVPVHVHGGDLEALRSPEALVAGFGYAPEEAEEAGAVLREQFHVQGPHVRPVERRTARRHLEQLTERGRVTEVEPGRYHAV